MHKIEPSPFGQSHFTEIESGDSRSFSVPVNPNTVVLQSKAYNGSSPEPKGAHYNPRRLL
jgi:hypothetical protein